MTKPKRYKMTMKNGQVYGGDPEAMHMEMMALQHMIADAYEAYADKTGRDLSKYTDLQEMMYIGGNAFALSIARICTTRVKDTSASELMDGFILAMQKQFDLLRQQQRDDPPGKLITGFEVN